MNGNCSELPPYLTEEILLKSLQEKAGSELLISDVKWKTPDLKGGHFVSAVNTLTVTTKTLTCGTKNKVKMFIKTATPDESRKEVFDSMKPTHKEVSFFNDILPTLQRFCQEESNEKVKLDKYPHCYFAAHNEYDPVVLEDLGCAGFTVNPVARDQDVHETKLVLKNMATFHAVSNAYLTKTGREIVDKHPFLTVGMFDPVMEAAFGDIFKRCWALTSGVLNEPEHAEKFELLTEIGKNLFKNFQSVNQPEDPFSVLCMGDCWNNNIMFKYDENGKSIDLKFIDFQIVRYDTMVYDIAYFLLTSTDHTKWKSHINEYLQVYYDNFSKVICSLKSTKSCPFSYEEFENHFYQRAPIGFPMMCNISCIRFMPHDQFSDPTDANEGGNFLDEFVKALETMIAGKDTKDILKNRMLASFDIVEQGFKSILQK